MNTGPRATRSTESQGDPSADDHEIVRQLAAMLPASDQIWLRNLTISGSPPFLKIRLPHPLFARWFDGQKRLTFESCLKRIFGLQSLSCAYTIGSLPDPATPHAASTHAPQPEFIITQKNAFAASAVLQIARDQGPSLTTLYGISGSGKTALLNCLYRLLIDKTSMRQVMFCQAADFFASAPLRHPEIGSWCHKYAYLLLDDVQTTDEEMGDVLAEYADQIAKGQGFLILAWSGRQQEATTLSRRLMSRIHQGLQLELPEEDLELRVRWIEKLNRSWGNRLRRDELLQLARKLGSASQLAGLEHKLKYFLNHYGRCPEVAELEELLPGSEAPPDWRALLAAVGRRFKLTVQDLLNPGRQAEKVKARQIAMYLCRKQLALSFPQIGMLFGGRDHTTVIHAVKKIEEMVKTDKVMHKLITELSKTGQKPL